MGSHKCESGAYNVKTANKGNTPEKCGKAMEKAPSKKPK